MPTGFFSFLTRFFTKIVQKKIGFWILWTLVGTLVIPISYLLSIFVNAFVHGAFGFTSADAGTPLSQTLMMMAGGAATGLGAGIYQKLLLEKIFHVKNSWIYVFVTGFAVAELLACIVLRLIGFDRSELRFIELKPLPESLIYVWIGLLTGFLQWMILRKSFSGSFFWIIASALGWGICFLMMAYPSVFPALPLFQAVTPFHP